MGEIIERASNSVLRTCPVCGKNFIPTHAWAYKLGSKFYCRYNCYRKEGGDTDQYREYVKGKRL